MNIVRIVRSEKESCAVKLRELARRIEQGRVAYAAIYSMDGEGRVEEVIYEQQDERLIRSA